MNYVFYDFETSGNNKDFDQILQIGAVLADEGFQIKDKINISCRLKKNIIPAPEALLINKRRWNLKLKNNILIKLPENNIKEALENYKKIYINFSNEELSDIATIDLRMKQKIILKYKETLERIK